MTTSRRTSLLSEISEGAPEPREKLAYFQARLQARLYDFVMSRFEDVAEQDGLTRAELARRIGRKPEIITRLFSSPGNWRLATVSDLLIGIAGEELEMGSASVLNRGRRNDTLPSWATHQELRARPSPGLVPPSSAKPLPALGGVHS